MSKRGGLAKTIRQATQAKTAQMFSPRMRENFRTMTAAVPTAVPFPPTPSGYMLSRALAPANDPKPVIVEEYDPLADLLQKPRAKSEAPTPTSDLERAAIGCKVIRYCRLCGQTRCSAYDAMWVTILVPDRMVDSAGNFVPGAREYAEAFYGNV